MISVQRGIWRLRPSNLPSAFGFKIPISRLSPSPMLICNRRTMKTSTNDGDNDELFTYTSGRFLYNEERRLDERRVNFDVAALKRVAEQHIRRGKITRIQKLAEGGFNRVFLLTSQDGFQAIAKIPYNITVPKHYTTASEVATMDFLQTKGIPVPRVYGWCSDSNNPVGAEYIVMEKAAGIPIETRWFDLCKKERHYLVTSLVDIETKLFDVPLGHYGSIYYKNDVPLDLQRELYAEGMVNADMSTADSRFCIGPTTDYMFWYGKRAGLEIDRGPWKTPKDYLVSIGEREMEWTKRYGKPRCVRFPHVVNFEGIKSPNEHVKLLSQYVSIAPYLLGENPQSSLNRPTLRHPDLTPGNIFVCPETHKISCILDWQHATLLPLLLVTGHPPLFQSPDSPAPQTLEKPALPDDYDSLGPEEKSQADELHRRRALFYIYMAFTGGLNERHLSVMQDPRVLLAQHLVDRAEKQWSGDTFSLKGALIRVAENWGNFHTSLDLAEPVPCPISFPASEVDMYYEQEPTWFQMNALMGYWKAELRGVSDDGWVRSESYDELVEKSKELKQVLLDGSDTPEEVRCVQEQWPFQDHEEDMDIS